MTQDDIIKMAREVESTEPYAEFSFAFTFEELERFVHMAQAAEREKNKRLKVSEWQGLTDAEIEQVALFAGCDPELDDGALVIRLCRVIEAKLKEKNK